MPRIFRDFFGAGRTGPGTARNRRELLRRYPSTKKLNAGFRLRVLRTTLPVVKLTVNDQNRTARDLEIAVRESLARSKNHTYEEVRHCPMVDP